MWSLIVERFAAFQESALILPCICSPVGQNMTGCKQRGNTINSQYTKKQRDDTKKENKNKEQIQIYFPVSPLSKWFRTLRTHSTIAIEIEIDMSWTLLFLHPFSKIHIKAVSLWRSLERHLYEIWDWYWIFSEKWGMAN